MKLFWKKRPCRNCKHRKHLFANGVCGCRLDKKIKKMKENTKCKKHEICETLEDALQVVYGGDYH